jgi:hypothetical protein
MMVAEGLPSFMDLDPAAPLNISCHFEKGIFCAKNINIYIY